MYWYAFNAKSKIIRAILAVFIVATLMLGLAIWFGLIQPPLPQNTGKFLVTDAAFFAVVVGLKLWWPEDENYEDEKTGSCS